MQQCESLKQKILDAILSFEAQGEPVDFTKGNPTMVGLTDLLSRKQAAYDEAVANYEALEGQSVDPVANMKNGMPMFAIIEEPLLDLPNYKGKGRSNGPWCKRIQQEYIR